jgi:hypothetical protein
MLQLGPIVRFAGIHLVHRSHIKSVGTLLITIGYGVYVGGKSSGLRQKQDPPKLAEVLQAHHLRLETTQFL